MNTMEVEFNKIKLVVRNPQMWLTAERLCGSVEKLGPGYFELALSAQNLSKIYQYFTGENKVTITKGQHFVDSLRDRLKAFKAAKAITAEIVAADTWPIPPNGKFSPYKHQTRIMGVTMNNPFSFIGADCGTGKTGSTARSVEELISKGELRKGGTLISVPLSILETSWLDDIKKFTNLNACVLWSDMTNKVLLGEEVTLTDYGPKPENTISVKTKTETHYRNRFTGQHLDRKPTGLDRPENFDKVRVKAKWAYLQDGASQRYGLIVGQFAKTENTKEMWVQSALDDPQFDLYLINHDGVKIYEELLKAKNFDCVIIDESTKIKSATADVTWTHVNISWKAKHRHCLSGTPNPNGYVDLWTQFYFLDRGLTLAPNLKDFLHEYFNAIPVGNFFAKGDGEKKAAVKYAIKNDTARDNLVERVRASGIFIDQRDCLDLPERTNLYRLVRMTRDQTRAYTDMEDELVAQLLDVDKNESVTSEASNRLAQIMRLRQITSGFLVGQNDERIALTKNPKYEECDNLLEEIGPDKKVIIVGQFREEIEGLLHRYKSRNAMAIYGDTDKSQIKPMIDRFQNDDVSQIMIVNPAAAAHGITLTRAHYMIIVSLSYNMEHYFQVIKRMERIGQKNRMVLYHLLALLNDGTPTMDEDLVEILRIKQIGRDSLFNTTQNVELDEDDIAKQLEQKLIRRHNGR